MNCVICNKGKEITYNKLAFCNNCFNVFFHENKNTKIMEPTKITGNIYLGNDESAANKKRLIDLDIKNILVVGNELKKHHPDEFNYHVLNLEDSKEGAKSIIGHVKKGIQFIDSSVANNQNILVHCKQGKSRSSTVCIAYLMHKNNMSFGNAYNVVKSKRPIIKPNSYFVRELNYNTFR